MFQIFGENYSIFTVAVYSILLYLAASLRIVGPKELGCVLFLGRPWRNVSSGWVFVPLLICWLVTETRLVIQDELPAEPEKIYRASEGDPEGSTVPPELQALGMRPPIRVTFAGRNEEKNTTLGLNINKDDPYDNRMTEEVVPVIRWRIGDFKTFLTVIGSVDEAKRQMEDTCVKMFTEELTKVSPAVALLLISEYSLKLQTAIEKLVHGDRTDTNPGWGIHLESAQIKAIRFSKTLNVAVQNVVVQERNKMAKIREGEGLGGREEAILNGRTNGLTKMAKDLDVKGHAVLGAETARAIAGEGDKSSQRTIIAGSGGFTDLVGTAAAIAKSFADKEGAK
ncbi:MAG: hypothetical protein Q8P23_02120 [bacterium]|nr:hypothetical protein [bacterium]